MTRVLFITGFLISKMLLSSSFINLEDSRDTLNGEKIQKHIKFIKIDDEGNKTELDTFIGNDDVFVWNDDSITSDHNWEWIVEKNLNLDSLHKRFDFDIDIDEDGENKVIIMKSHEIDAPLTHEFRFDNKFPPGPPHPPLHSGMIHIEKDRGSNVIDLSDPGIVSFKKTQKKDGLEKIIIVRKTPDAKDNKLMKEIFIHDVENLPEIDARFPHQSHTVKIIKADDGTEIIEENGKVIKIKKESKGDDKEIEIEVEVNEDEKQDDN